MPARSSLALIVAACGAALLAASACGNSTPSGNPSGSAGTATTGGGAGGGGGAATAGVAPVAGSATTAGAGTGGSGGASGAGAGGSPNVACKAGATAVNGSGLTVSAPDISAFKFSNSAPYMNPPDAIMKIAYDPVGKVLVVLSQKGKLYKFDPNVPIPTTASTMPLTMHSDYDSGGYAPEGNFTDHRGIVFGPDGALYVLAASSDNVGVAIRKGVPGAGGTGPRTWSTIVTTTEGFPSGGTNFDHSFAGIAISPDGTSLYFSSGSRTDHGEPEKGLGEVPLSSAVFKVPTTGTTMLKNDTTSLQPFLFADGTRNAFDMAFNANGDLIGCDNGPDMDLPDEINFFQQGKHYGFPYRFGAVNNPVGEAGYTAANDKRLHSGYQAVDENKYVYDATLAPPAGAVFVDPITNMGPDANVARADRNAEPAKVTGLAGITGHRSPLGITFDVEGKSCGPYYKQGFVLSYGSVKADALGDEGRDLLLLSLTKTGETYSMTTKQIAKGIESPMDAVLVGNKLFTIGYGGAPMYVFILPTP
jgi:hypothetical protein